jgi:hypothetical protein
VTGRKHVDGCQCNRCAAPAGYDPERPPYCVHCHQVLTWQRTFGWVLWGWAGRGVNATEAALCHAPTATSHLHVAGGPGVKPDLNAAHLSLNAVIAAAAHLSQPHCKYCSYGLEWKHDSWWAEAKSDGHLWCERNPDPGSSKHVPVGPSCTMGPECGCPFHDDSPWPDPPPPRRLKSGGRYYPRSFPVTDGPASDRTPKVARTPMDELYAGTTGRALPPDTYLGWGREWTDTGLPYAKERMVSHVSLTTPEEGFRWDDPAVTFIPARPPVVTAPVPPPELTAARSRELRRAGLLWLLAAALSWAGIALNFPPLMAMGAVIWFLQLVDLPRAGRRTTRNTAKTKPVEGKHAKSRQGPGHARGQ